jgi:methylmalonyl-CoA mutase cobalamin-binding subunit
MIVAAALQEDADVIGLSILSGAQCISVQCDGVVAKGPSTSSS